jgi:hypothetical protein
MYTDLSSRPEQRGNVTVKNNGPKKQTVKTAAGIDFLRFFSFRLFCGILLSYISGGVIRVEKKTREKGGKRKGKRKGERKGALVLSRTYRYAAMAAAAGSVTANVSLRSIAALSRRLSEGNMVTWVRGNKQLWTKKHLRSSLLGVVLCDLCDRQTDREREEKWRLPVKVKIIL